jgi:hypothetical protein
MAWSFFYSCDTTSQIILSLHIETLLFTFDLTSYATMLVILPIFNCTQTRLRQGSGGGGGGYH